MNPDAQRVRDLFVAAVKLPPDRWGAFLEEACGGDEELRRQVRDLLREHQQVGSFLDRPAVSLAATGDFDPAADGVATPLQENTGELVPGSEPRRQPLFRATDFDVAGEC